MKAAQPAKKKLRSGAQSEDMEAEGGATWTEDQPATIQEETENASLEVNEEQGEAAEEGEKSGESQDASKKSAPPKKRKRGNSEGDGSRKRPKSSYVWQYVRDFDQDKDNIKNKGRKQCTLCQQWLSGTVNASGWKRHLRKHGISEDPEVDGEKTASSAPKPKPRPQLADGTEGPRGMRPKTSYVWQYVKDYEHGTDDPVNKNRKQCSRCEQWLAGSINASGWKRHLRKHGIEDPGEEGGAPVERKAPTVGGSRRNKKKRNGRGRFGGRLDPKSALVDYIISSLLPHQIVESDALKTFFSALSTGGSAPSSQSVARQILEKYVAMIPEVRDLIAKLDVKYTISIHKVKTESHKEYFVLTGHWVDTEAKAPKSVVLYTLEVDSSDGNGERAGRELFDALKLFCEHSMEKIFAVVGTNDAATIAVADNITEKIAAALQKQPTDVFQVRPLDDVIQQAVKAAISSPSGEEAIDKVRTLVKHVRATQSHRQIFRKEATSLDSETIEPPSVDLPNSWFSTIDLLDASLKKKDALDAVASEIEDLREYQLASSDWDKVEKLVELFQPIKALIHSLAKEKPCSISAANGRIQLVNDHLDGLVDARDAFISDAAQEAKDVIVPYKNLLASAETVLFSKFVDARLKKPGVKSTEGARHREAVIDILRRAYAEQIDEETVVEEVDKFLGVQAKTGSDLLEWWTEHKETYPVLYRLAMDVLAIPGSLTYADTAYTEEESTVVISDLLSNEMLRASFSVRSWLNAGLESIDEDAADDLDDDLKDVLEDLLLIEGCAENGQAPAALAEVTRIV